MCSIFFKICDVLHNDILFFMFYFFGKTLFFICLADCFDMFGRFSKSWWKRRQWRLMIECSSRAQKKSTAHHKKTRPRKTQARDNCRFHCFVATASFPQLLILQVYNILLWYYVIYVVVLCYLCFKVCYVWDYCVSSLMQVFAGLTFFCFFFIILYAMNFQLVKIFNV